MAANNFRTSFLSWLPCLSFLRLFSSAERSGSGAGVHALVPASRGSTALAANPYSLQCYSNTVIPTPFHDDQSRCFRAKETRSEVTTLTNYCFQGIAGSLDDIPCEIEEGLYLGSCLASFNQELLKCLNVTHILSVLPSEETPYPDDFKYKTIKVLDRPDENIQRHFSECFQFIDEARQKGGGILVHCQAGRVSRSATIVIAYLMKKHKMNLLQALHYVQSRRPEVMPNWGFMYQLKDLESSLQRRESNEQRRVRRPAQALDPLHKREYNGNSG